MLNIAEQLQKIPLLKTAHILRQRTVHKLDMANALKCTDYTWEWVTMKGSQRHIERLPLFILLGTVSNLGFFLIDKVSTSF